MRDLKRIDRILKLLGKIWKQNPDWRFFQLLENTTGEAHGSWHTEDDFTEKALMMWIAKSIETP